MAQRGQLSILEDQLDLVQVGAQVGDLKSIDLSQIVKRTHVKKVSLTEYTRSFRKSEFVVLVHVPTRSVYLETVNVNLPL